MSIRRTKEERYQAKLRREEGQYSWKPQAEKSKKTTVSHEKAPDTKRQDDGYFWKDVRRTVIATLIVATLLGIAYYTLVS